MDVEAWLRGLGLEQYKALFRENDIDAEVLSDLTDGDLETMACLQGMQAPSAIAVLAGPAGRAPPGPSYSDPASGGRRRAPPITVMFCDLVGSTSLAARLDAEDWRNLVGAYLDAASRR